MSEKDFKIIIQKLNKKLSTTTSEKGFRAVQDEVEFLIQSFHHKWTGELLQGFSALISSLSNPLLVHHIAALISTDGIKKCGRELAHIKDSDLIDEYLDIIRSSAFLTRIYDDEDWPELILNLLQATNYTYGRMFFHRVEKYPNKILFTVLNKKKSLEYSWSEISSMVLNISAGLVKMLGENPSNQKIAFLTKNSLDMVLYDLACLTTGIVNVMIPANSVPSHIDYILNKTEPSILIVSDRTLLDKIDAMTTRMEFLKAIVLFEKNSTKQKDIFSTEDVLNLGTTLAVSVLEDFRGQIKLEDLASVMFTSGTTGNPKGIQFTHQNLVFKRFARAMALPEIGENDVFLAYLPLFHTFGRWLEMTGCVFWAANYVFMENPAPETMIENMQRVKPSVFISIPKKWYQLYEFIDAETNIVKSSNEEIQQTVAKLTGGNLKWGLSAAGHLDSEIFEFFQHNGVELMSGFGMTEATGGITMTPPGKYKPGSLGKALPGIALKMADDGELLIKGPYVMPGYVNPEESDSNIQDGWLPTGDIMQMDENGFIKIIDRKKEIYKNIKGETIAPQKIENFFRDFDFIQHVFLVGDHRPFNTLLIYPNYNFKEVNFRIMSEGDLRTYFSSVIVSVNRFLAPFEKIVDFVIIDRDFDPDKNELTPKGTYRRKVVETNFENFIQPMYDRSYHQILLAGYEIQFPNWFLREKGLTSQEIRIENDQLFINDSPNSLTLKFDDDNVQIGDFVYEVSGKKIDMGIIFTDPQLWLGNSALVELSNEKIFNWTRHDDSNIKIRFKRPASPLRTDLNIDKVWRRFKQESNISLWGLHTAALILQRAEIYHSSEVFDYIQSALQDKESVYIRLGKEILKRTLYSHSIEAQRKAFIILLNAPTKPESAATNRAFLDLSVNFINKKVIEEVCSTGVKDKKLSILFEITREYCEENNKRCVKLFRLLSGYGAIHPTRYKIIRQFLVSCQLENYESSIRRAARIARLESREGFRKWLGTTQEVAVDLETNKEYHWEDVIIFEESIEKTDRDRLISAIKYTTLIREAVFLFSGGVLVRLNDIPPGGLWVSLLGKEHGKAVYRITIQTRYQGSFDIAINVNHDIAFEDILEEIKWLIRSGTSAGDVKLVEDFGGYWKEFDLWSEEFIQGETAGKFIIRTIRQHEEAMNDRLRQIWPYFIWSGVSAYAQFWKRTKNRLELEDPTPTNIIIPKHDYQEGSRIVSISARRPHINVLDMLKNLIINYMNKSEDQFDVLKGIGKTKYVFSGIIESLGHDLGISFLDECLNFLKAESQNKKNKILLNELQEYLESVKENGYIPKRLYFAIKRYHRWRELNQSATSQARASTLTELYETYQLNKLEIEYPETRTRFFRETVFAHAQMQLRDDLKGLILEQQNKQISEEKFTQHVSTIQKALNLNEEELFFLARLSYPHLQPTDSADLISLEKEGIAHTDLVVRSKDYDGGSFFIRTPVNPKEIARLHQLFIQNHLYVQFRPDHLYLIALNERSQLIGGMFYKKISDDTTHIEKIVVDDYYRKKGISDGLLNEYFKRMKNDHYFYVTTGFFRPEYFYRFGFKIERKYAGLVKSLVEEEPVELSIS